ncbi:MAG: ImmA/IrrE family metallo-endopeptidase [Pseudomonadota bacterium]
MSILEKIVVGDKERFGVDILFQGDPDNGQGATPEESLSWGALEIWIKGKNICSHVEDGALVSSITWYLLPVIEWLAANWDPLLHEERLPNRNLGDDARTSLQATRFAPESLDPEAESEWSKEWQEWRLRHCLQSCRGGGLLPDLVFRRWRDKIEISWGKEVTLPGFPEDAIFVYHEGVARLEPLLVAGPLHELINKTLAVFLAAAPSSVRFQALAARIRMIADAPTDDRLAWLAGLGTSYKRVKERWQRVTSCIQRAGSELAGSLLEVKHNEFVIEGSCQAALMFGSVSPSLSDGDIQKLVQKLIELYAPDSENSRLRSLVEYKPVADDGAAAWDDGYDLAGQVIDELSLDQQDFGEVDIGRILTELGIVCDEIALDDQDVRGVSIAGPHHRPSILVNSSDAHNETSPGRRFTLAHEICHILFDRTYGQKLAMASGDWAPRQVEQRANAFAAMLLMPSARIRKVVAELNIPLTSEQAVHEVRKHFGTSFKAALGHLKNLGLLDPATAERISEKRETRLAAIDQ